MLAQELASAVHTELRGRTYTKVREGLYLGDLSGPESRLTLLWLGVRGVVTVASHDIERLWMADGIAYHTAIVDTSADSIGPCLPASCAFLDRHNSAFVCCAAGQGLSLLVCAAHLATSERWASHGPGGPVSETPGELLRELAAQCAVRFESSACQHANQHWGGSHWGGTALTHAPPGVIAGDSRPPERHESN